MRHKCLAVCAVLMLGILIPVVSAQEKDEAVAQPVQEVFRTRLVYPQERGEVQFSYSSRFSKGKDSTHWQTPITLEYGITDRWQVEIEWDSRSSRTETGEATTRGRGDFSVGTQYSFMNVRRSDFHTAVGLEVTFPTGSSAKELSEGFVEFEPYFIIAKDFPKLNNLQIFSQVGMGFVQRPRNHVVSIEDEPSAHEVSFGMGMFLPFRRLVFTGEFNFSTNRWNNGGSEREMSATPGVVWRLPRNWEMGIGVPVGLNRHTDRTGAIFKLVYEFGTRRDGEAH